MEGIYLSSASYLLVVGLGVALTALAVARWVAKQSGHHKATTTAPGPQPWPLLGSLHLLGGYELPYQAFDALSAQYGPVVSLRLGQVDCLVVSSYELVKEVLFNKGEQFDGRPSFARFVKLFGGDKDNSLAFCDWSDLQKTRREILRDHTFPRAFSSKFHQLESLLNREMVELFSALEAGATDIKPLILFACANVFLSYFTSTRFNRQDPEFVQMVNDFDDIFYEVNQGYAVDFLPWLKPLYMGVEAQMNKCAAGVRGFFKRRVMPGGEPGDLLSALMESAKSGAMSQDIALYALEDMIGGHTAVGSFIVKTLCFLSEAPEVQARMQEEVDRASCGQPLRLEDREAMPYTDAVILEAIRLICTPIVPHVASHNTSINDYDVKKGTLVFLNNYTLNMSGELWKEPAAFRPERFLAPDGRLVKPEHFLPFGGGRRSCMGYKMTQFVSFATLASLIQRYNIVPHPTNPKVPLGNLAVPSNTFKFNFKPR